MPVSDVSRSPATRVHCIYDLTPQLRLATAASLSEVYDYGRVRRHVEAAAQLLPKVAFRRGLPAGVLGLAGEPASVGEATVLVLVTPRSDPLLVLDLELPGEATTHQVAALLATTCFERERLTVAGRPVLPWLAGEFPLPAPVEFGGNVHQCVFAGGTLGDHLLATMLEPAPAVTTIVYRNTVSPDRGSQLGIRAPAALNNPGESLVATRT